MTVAFRNRAAASKHYRVVCTVGKEAISIFFINIKKNTDKAVSTALYNSIIKCCIWYILK
jgi:hypothetical protein